MGAIRKSIPRIVLAGTNSGCGKTTISCSLMQALVDRGLKTGAFKCGPDYIDPMFHSRIIGAKSANLDTFFFDDNTLNYLLAVNGEDRDISVIEGVMGFYDGIIMESFKASTHEVSVKTKSPVVLVVGAKGASLSVLATIKGFLEFTKDNNVKGVILNQCTAMTYKMLADAIRKHFAGQVVPLGYMPSMPDCAIESRHLGLVTAAEIEDLKDKMHRLSLQAEKSLDIDGIIELANQAAEVECEAVTVKEFNKKVRIAVARDKAFCFYYEDSVDILKRMGAEIVPFSPLEDTRLPENIQGMYLGGGYPELYTRELSANKELLKDIKQALENHVPCIAECGGFMYLTEAIADSEMVGYLKGKSYDTGKLCRFGYVDLIARKDNMLCKAGESIKGHEFHHWDCEYTGEDFRAVKYSGKEWACVLADDNMYAGYPHFHFYSNPVFGENFYRACVKYGEGLQ